jgi:hypothetical protein
MNPRLSVAISAIIIAQTLCLAQSAQDQGTEESLHEAHNPIATRISVPFQSNSYFSAGPQEKTTNALVIEPVIPIARTKRWNVISRWVARVVYAPRPSPDQGSEFGLGNLQPEFYLSPEHIGKVTWGVGSRLYLPTATGHEFGNNKVGGGPAAAALAVKGRWLVGILANNVWAGSGSERVDRMTLSPFLYYHLEEGWYFVSSPVLTSNWAATSGDRWTVPIGGGFGRQFKIDDQAVNLRFQSFYNAARPAFAPSWQLQVQVQLLFSKRD